MTHWSDVLRLSDDESKPVVITAAGTFPATGVPYVPPWAKGPVPGTMTIQESYLDDMVAAFEDKDLGTDAFIDSGEHKQGAATAIFQKLWKAPFTDNHGKQRMGLWGQPAWTELGRKLIGDKQFGYLSILMGPHGKNGRMAMFSATPTNKPVMTILPRIALESDGIDAASLALAQDMVSAVHPRPYELLALSEVDFVDELALSEVTDKGGHGSEDYAYTPNTKVPASWKLPIYDAAHVGAACAALASKSDIPEADLPKVKQRVVAAWKKFYPDEDPEKCPLKLERQEPPNPKGVTMPPDKPDEALELEATNAALEEQKLALEATNAALEEQKLALAQVREEQRKTQLEADAIKAKTLPYDMPTINAMISLSQVWYGAEMLALAEDAPKQRPFDLVYDLLAKAVKVPHTTAEGFVALEQADEETFPSVIELTEAEKAVRTGSKGGKE